VRALAIALAVVTSVVACQERAAPAGSSDGAPAVASAFAVDPPKPAASVPAARAPASSWQGSYKSVAGSLYIPTDWKTVRWKVAESPSGIGEGALSLTLGGDGSVRGVLDGPLGPAVIAGMATNRDLMANVRPGPSGEPGFAGTLAATIAGDRIEGTIHVSSGLVDAVRMATFALRAESAPER
jgi:hypothetical protein